MNKFDPKIDEDNPPLDAAFMAGMKPAQVITSPPCPKTAHKCLIKRLAPPPE
jgi:hypothetical protein